MREPIGYGVDFGTTNSLIAVAYEDGVEVVSFRAPGMDNAEECLPSIVYFDHDGDQFAGVEAVQQYEMTARRRIRCHECRGPGTCTRYQDWVGPRPRGMKRGPAPRCPYSRITYGIKQELAVEGYLGTESWGGHFTLEDMCSWILGDLAQAASANGSVRSLPVVMGAPVEFECESEAKNGQEIAVSRLRIAAKAAGLEVLEFLREPEAALMYEKYELGSPAADPVAVAVDFGGGTFDVAVSSTKASPWSSTATAGVAIGGELFDGYLFRRHLLHELGLERADERLLHRLCSLRSMAINAGRDEFHRDLKALRDRGGASAMLEILEGGFIYDLWKSVRDAKATLSSSETAFIDFHKHGIDLRIPVERSEFETMIKLDLERIRQVISQALECAGARASDVSVVLRTGGSSSIPAFIAMLHEMFPNATVTEQPTMTTIVTGLAHRAREIGGVATVSVTEPTAVATAARDSSPAFEVELADLAAPRVRPEALAQEALFPSSTREPEQEALFEVVDNAESEHAIPPSPVGDEFEPEKPASLVERLKRMIGGG